MHSNIPSDKPLGPTSVAEIEKMLKDRNAGPVSPSNMGLSWSGLVFFLIAVGVYAPFGWKDEELTLSLLQYPEGVWDAHALRTHFHLLGSFMIPIACAVGLTSGFMWMRLGGRWNLLALMLVPRFGSVWFGLMEIGGFPLEGHPHFRNDWIEIIQLLLGVAVLLVARRSNPLQ